MRTVMAIFSVGLVLGTPSAALAGEVLVAVAANFLSPMKQLGVLFEERTGHKVVLSSGSTGKLYAQIRHGAPYEVFLSADVDRPRRLEEEGLAVPHSRFTYAIGLLVLWTMESRKGPADSREVLRKGTFRHLAIANPKTAPYGRAAAQVLRRWNLWDHVSPRLALGENVAQAFQFVASGNAELGIVGRSQIEDPRFSGAGTRWDIPIDLYDPLEQDALLLRVGQANPVARALLAFLRSPAAREVVTRYGYALE